MTGEAPINTPPRHGRPSSLDGLNPSALLACAAKNEEWSPPELEALEQVLPGYQFVRLLGRGGMGAVYEALQLELDRTVAVKIRPLQARFDNEAVDRFKREAKALARLNHPRILSIHHSGVTEDGDFYIVTEFVDGEDLGQRLKRGALPVTDSILLLMAICEALEFAHSGGVIHRDLKPSNVLLGKTGEIKLADFGLAVFVNDTVGERVTRVTSNLGTLEYSAPEQLSGSREVTPALDVYSLGVLAYELLTGQLPRGAFEKPSAAGRIDSAFDGPLMRALSGDPAARWASVSEFKAALLEAHETALLAGTIEVLGGSQANLIESFYKQAVADISPALSMAIEDQLLTSSGYRDSRALEDILRLPGINQSEIQKLIARRVLRLEKRGGRDFLELAHDRLTGAVHARREARRSQEQSAAAASREETARNSLRKRSLLAAVFAVTAAITFLSAGFAWLKKAEAQRQQLRADSTRNEAEKLISFLVEDLQNRLDEIGRLDVMKTSIGKVEDYYNSIPPGDQNNLSLDHKASFYFTRGQYHRLSGNMPAAFKDFEHAVDLTSQMHQHHPTVENALKHVRSLNSLGRFYSLKQDFTNALSYHSHSKSSSSRWSRKPLLPRCSTCIPNPCA